MEKGRPSIHSPFFSSIVRFKTFDRMYNNHQRGQESLKVEEKL